LKLAALLVFVFSLASAAQEITITGPHQAESLDVSLHYSLTVNDEFAKNAKLYPDMAPTTILWMWNDGPEGKAFTYYPYAKGLDVRHTYKKGEYTVIVSVIDRKNRLIRQDRIHFKVLASPIAID